MELYHKTASRISKIVTRSYSTSFSLGISLFSPSFRDAIYGIYGFVRLADEIVDTFHDYDKNKLMSDFRKDTDEALNNGLSTNPVIHSFVRTVKQYDIDYSHIRAFLDSMEMDLSNSYYENKEYDNYIYGSAEVVGLMCLQVFCGNNISLYNELIDPAKALGSAFQKVNFLRDIKSDIDERGRIYLPGVDKEIEISDSNKKNLESEIDKEFSAALNGIKRLPNGVKLGVYSAYLYYIVLFRKIKKMRIAELMKRRVRVSNLTKTALLIKSLVEVKIIKTT